MGMFNSFQFPDSMLEWLPSLEDEDLRDFVKMFKAYRDSNTVSRSFFANPETFLKLGFVTEDKTYADRLRFVSNFPVAPSLSKPRKPRAPKKETYLSKYVGTVKEKEIFKKVYEKLGYPSGKEESTVDVSSWLKQCGVLALIIGDNLSLIDEAYDLLLSAGMTMTQPASFTKTITRIKTSQNKPLDLT